MFAKIKIVTEQKEGVIKLPAAAVVERFGEKFVFVVQGDSEVERRPVKVGIRINGKQEIIEGLEDGETVVVRGQTLLEDGSAVKVVQRTEPLAVSDSIE